MISFAAAAVNEKGEVLSTFLGACCPFSLSEGKDGQRYDLLSLCTVQGADVPYTVHTHPNEITDRIAAEAILSFLNQQPLIPDQLIPNTVLKDRANYYQLHSKQKQIR